MHCFHYCQLSLLKMVKNQEYQNRDQFFTALLQSPFFSWNVVSLLCFIGLGSNEINPGIIIGGDFPFLFPHIAEGHFHF